MNDMLQLDNYNKNRGIYSPLIEHNGIVCGYWLCGQDYHNKTGYYGAYPPSYLKRIKLLFPLDFPCSMMMHLFSGKVERGIWNCEVLVDSNPELNPTIVHDAETISEISDKPAFDLVLADPPYNNNHTKYGTKKVNKKKVIRECSKILNMNGYLVWLDTSIPIWAKADGWKLRGTIGLNQSTNHLTRTITILQKVNYGTRPVSPP
jgi:hypothetical protein